MLLFDVAQFEGILKKVAEFNNSLSSDAVSALGELKSYIRIVFTKC